MRRRRVRPTRSGTFKLRLADEERDLLRHLPGQLRELLQADDPALERLFPDAYTDDDQASTEFSRLMKADLVAGRMGAIEVLEATIDLQEVDTEQLSAWLSVLNDLRLVIGTQLEVSEEMDEEDMLRSPEAHMFAMYYYLSELEGEVIEALADGLDDAGTEI